MKLRRNQALRLALLASLISLPCDSRAEEPIFALRARRPISQRISPRERDAEVDLIGYDSEETEPDESAIWPNKKLAARDSLELLADGPGDLPPPMDWSTQYHTSEAHITQTPGAYDTVGSQIGAFDPNRPLYPYHAKEYWMAQDADPESWGDLAELPFVELGWFANAEASVFAAKVFDGFNSGTLLDGVFPGDPLMLGVSSLDVSVSPRIEIGYRHERGLGETRFGYQFYDFKGGDIVPGYDLGADARRTSHVQGHVFDLDFCEFEFNPEGLPLIHPLFKFAGRCGLGRPLTAQLTPPLLEMRFVIGGRGANYITEVEAIGPNTTDRVFSNFWGGGLHFTWDLNQRVSHDLPFYWHLRADGSGTFGRINQGFTRVRGANSASAIDPQIWIGVPTVSLEAGFSWVPHLPNRNSRVTLAYHYEEWFAYGQATDSNVDLAMNGILLRGEWKY